MKRLARQTAWLVAYDLRQQAREPGTWLLLAVALLLALLALAQGDAARRATARTAEQALTQQAQARARSQAAADRYFANPADPRNTGQPYWRSAFDLRGYAFREHVGFAVKPALPGAALAIGQGDVLPAVVRVKVESMDSVRQAADIEHPQRLLAGRFDLLFFVVCLWPLVLLALLSSVLTQDRENRRLPSLALLGVTPGRVLLVQSVARGGAAGGLLVLVVGAAALLAGALPYSLGGLGASAAWAGLVVAYSLFWSAVAALVCARAANRTTAAFAGFGAWVGLVVLLPAVLAAAVSLAAPLPGREGYIVAMRDAADRVQADRTAVMAAFYDQHPEWRPERTPIDQLPAAVTRLARAAELERALAGVETRFDGAREQQADLLRAWSALSPVSLVHNALSALAGQDAARHARFVAEVQQHQRALRNFFQARIQRAARHDEREPCPPARITCRGGYGFDDFAAVPRFEASAGLEAVPATAGTAALLLTWSASLLAAAALLARPAKSAASTDADAATVTGAAA